VLFIGGYERRALTNTAGNMPPEGFQRRINLLGRNIVSLDTWMTTGLCKFTQILQLPQNTKGGIARC
jgi:hypothetical protein